MNGEDSEQFDAGIPGATYDTYFNQLALQRIRIRIWEFNSLV